MPGTQGCPQLLWLQRGPHRRSPGQASRWGWGGRAAGPPPLRAGGGGRWVLQQWGPEATQVTLGPDVWPSQRGPDWSQGQATFLPECVFGRAEARSIQRCDRKSSRSQLTPDRREPFPSVVKWNPSSAPSFCARPEPPYAGTHLGGCRGPSPRTPAGDTGRGGADFELSQAVNYV